MKQYTTKLVHKKSHLIKSGFWELRGLDSNQRPSGYEPDELPTAPPRGANISQRVSRKQANSTNILIFFIRVCLSDIEC